ncbi:MAG: glycosyltransferase, partial [Nautiliaceae bacterium]
IPLYIIGKGNVNLIKKDGIKYLGFVSEEEKHRYLKSAAALIHPSLNESLGIVLIESFANFSPAVVNKNSNVLFSHIRNSKAGEAFETYEEFENALLKILKNRKDYSQNAYRYYKDFYSSDAFEKRIKKHIIQTP